MASRVGSLHRMALHGPAEPALIQELTGSLSGGPQAARVGRRSLFDSDATLFRDDVAGVPGIHLIVETAARGRAGAGCWRMPGERSESWKRRVWPVGWAAFNATRIEGGRPLFGIDFEGARASAFPRRSSARSKQGRRRRGRSPRRPPGRDGPVRPGRQHHQGLLPGPGDRRADARPRAGRQADRRLRAGRRQPARRRRRRRSTRPIRSSGRRRHQQHGVARASRRAIGLAFVKSPHFGGKYRLVPAEGAMRSPRSWQHAVRRRQCVSGARGGAAQGWRKSK